MGSIIFNLELCLRDKLIILVKLNITFISCPKNYSFLLYLITTKFSNHLIYFKIARNLWFYVNYSYFQFLWSNLGYLWRRFNLLWLKLESWFFLCEWWFTNWLASKKMIKVFRKWVIVFIRIRFILILVVELVSFIILVFETIAIQWRNGIYLNFLLLSLATVDCIILALNCFF